MDGTISCGPSGSSDVGFSIKKVGHLLGDLIGSLEQGYKGLTGRENADFVGSKRFEHADWFQLVGAVADGGNPGRDGTHDRLTAFAIGEGCDFTPKESGYLYVLPMTPGNFTAITGALSLLQ